MAFRMQTRGFQRAACYAGALASLLAGIAAFAAEPVMAPGLKLSSHLSQSPAPRSPRPAPPPLDQPEALARHYFVSYPELDVPEAVIEVLARHYCSERPELAMPDGLLAAIVRHYRDLHPQRRPPPGLGARLEAL